MSPGRHLVVAATRAVQGADTAADVRAAVCDAAVDAGYEFACVRGEDAFVTASEPGVEPPEAADVTPTFRSASADASAAESASDPAGPDGTEDPDTDAPTATGPGADAPAASRSDAPRAVGPDADAAATVDGNARPVTCISRGDGYTVTVPVVDGDRHYGTLALGAADRVADADERDALAAAGVVVGQALTRVDAVSERDRLRETLRTERRQFEKLHSVAAAMVGCENESGIYHLAIDAAENILEFDVCGIDVVEDGYFVPVATSSATDPDGSQVMAATEGVAGHTYQENETVVVDDVDAHPLADPVDADYASLLSVPIEDVGLFQAASAERNAFSTGDAELVELLMAHVSATLQRLRSDEALRESEQKYRTLIEQSHDAVAIYRDGEFAFANQRATDLFGRDRDELLAADACECFHQEDLPKLERVAAELTDDVGRQQTFEGRIRRPDGGVRFCEFSATSIAYEGGVAVLASIRDITERKERERELERQNERLEEFASVVSHDLRSPINVARGSVDLARSSDDVEHLDRAADALDRMEALVEDVLRLARQGRLVDETEHVPLRDVARDAWQSIDAPEATLDVRTAAGVDADRTRLRELFENLFRNAVEHGSDDVTVTVTADTDRFVVADDGPGLPPDSHDEVFERGFTSSDDGTGFGLAIVESIADAHGWTVDAVPPADGDQSRGARFEISNCFPE